jgi:very-short-patch-repair endonuclease
VEYPASHDRRWRLDYAWPAQRVALEVEGGYWTGQGHSRAKRAAEDRQKHNALAVAGWIVLRCDPEELKAMSIVPTLALALETRAARSERGR